MTLLRLSPLALSRSRFALSPLAETFAAMRMLVNRATDPWAERWHATHAPAFQRRLAAHPFEAGLVDLALTTKWLPDLVAFPPPGGMGTRLADELPAVSAFPADRFRATVAEAARHSWKPHDLSWADVDDPGPRTARLFQAVWTAHVAPDWPRRRASLERDVMYRAGLLAAYGWPRALDRMSRSSAWEGADAIRFSKRPGPDRVVGDDGMLFVPVTLSAGTWLCEARDGGYALVYPARGPGAAPAPPAADALDRLVGRGRAAILRALERPATSTELAAELNVSLGTVGGHLAVLRDAGLVTGARVGRKVIYHRTGLLIGG